MAQSKLTPCRTCNEKVAASAKTCPRCGVNAPSSNATSALVALIAFLVLFSGCAVVLVVASSGGSDYEPRSPAEERELEQAERTVEGACSLWWAGALDLPDHQAQVCVDGNYGK